MATPYTWEPQSRATLTRVAWDSSYKDVVLFGSKSLRDSYFEGLENDSVVIEKMTYLKPNEPVKINIPFSKSYKYNYLVVENPALPVPNEDTPPKLFYFVTGAAMVNPSTTALQLQLDVFQTYIYNVCISRAFVERGHVAIHASNNTYDADYSKAKRRYCTVAEGLDYGSEYAVVENDYRTLMDQKTGSLYVVIVASTDLTADWGTKSAPSLKTATGQYVDNLVSGSNVYAVEASQFSAFMAQISAAPWVAKGIISLTAFPGKYLTFFDDVELNNGQGMSVKVIDQTPDGFAKLGDFTEIDNVISQHVPDRYHQLVKLYCYPYSVVEMSTFNGNALQLKPELFPYSKFSVRVASCCTPPHMKLGFYPDGYGRSLNATVVQTVVNYYTMGGNKTGIEVPMSYWLDCACWIENLPTFSIVNDNYALYLASTTNTRAYQYQAAGWGLQKSLAGSQMSYDLAQMGLRVNEGNMQTQNVQRIYNGVTGAVGAGLNGAAQGGVVGGVASALQSGMSSAVDYWAANDQFARNQEYANYSQNANYDLAKWSAQGDYETSIAGINAAVQDAALTQPSAVGQAGGEGFNIANGLFGLLVRYKAVDVNHMAVLGEFFLRYGYAVHEFMAIPESNVQNLHCMNHFTYWKMSEVYLSCADADESAKDTIRGIFEKGVTVWREPSELGTIDPATNYALKGKPYYG